MDTIEVNKTDNRTMKYLLALSLISILLLFGCEQGSDITSPENLSNPIEILTDIPDSIEVMPWPYPPGADSIFVLANLLPPEIPNLEESQVIDGHDGGRIIINYEYQDSLNNTISIDADLTFPADAFNGQREISIFINNQFGTISFYPHLFFNEPVKLRIEYQGLDVSGLNPDTFDFVYQHHNGTIENVEYDKLEIAVPTGKILLKDAFLWHFSRYGFVN